MHGRMIDRLVLALAMAIVPIAEAMANGGGRGGGGELRHPGAARVSVARRSGGFRDMSGAGRGLPPVSGVIHEGSQGRPSFSAYGHTATAVRIGGFGRGGVPGLGRAGSMGFADAHGRIDAGFRHRGARRFVGGGGFGGSVVFDGGQGAFDDIYGGQGVFGGQGVYGGQGSYGRAGLYGGRGTYGIDAAEGGYGDDERVPYRSETPLAARFAEPPLGPSPYAPYSPGVRFADTASADVGPGPRVVNPYRSGTAGCACGGQREAVVYRYGIGTAY